MFSKSKINEPAQKAPESDKPVEQEKISSSNPVVKPKPPASMLSQDLNNLALSLKESERVGTLFIGLLA